MQKILKIAQREYIETVKTKTFLIGILMTPVIIGGIIFFTSRISSDKSGPRPPVKVAVPSVRVPPVIVPETSKSPSVSELTYFIVAPPVLFMPSAAIISSNCVVRVQAPAVQYE